MLLAGLALVLARSIASPLGQVVGALEAVAAGDLRTRVNLKTTEEIGRMGAAMDHAAAAFARIVGDIRACQKVFRLADLRCKGAKDDACLSEAQVKALTRAFAGPTNTKVEALYSDWPCDGGIGAHDWRFWKIESPLCPVAQSLGDNPRTLFLQRWTTRFHAIETVFLVSPTTERGLP